ncbi:capsid protein [Crucivirus-133]|nr:capsid protein [Crucivirus-133]
MSKVSKKTVSRKSEPRRKKSSVEKTFHRFRKNYNKEYMFPGVGREIGGTIGSFAGPTGNLIGKAIGHGAHSLMKTVTGFGDYQVKGNSLMYNKDAVPEFTNNPRCTIIAHREYIGDVFSGPTLSAGATTFNATSFRINPGVAGTFPWLSSVAQNYEQYVIQGMIFEFKTNSATAVSSTNTALGTVIIASQYNSLAPEFNSKQQMENYEFCQSSVPSMSVAHPIECDPHQTQCGGIFNVWDPVFSTGDIRLYDIGRFTIATQGMQAVGINLGELWVTYKICMLKPRLTQIAYGESDVWELEVASTTSSAPFGHPVNALQKSLGIPISSLTNTNTFTISPNFTGYIICLWTLVNPNVESTDKSMLGSLVAGSGSTLVPVAALGDGNVNLNLMAVENSGFNANGQSSVIFFCPGGPNQTFTNTTANFNASVWLPELNNNTMIIASINWNNSINPA